MAHDREPQPVIIIVTRRRRDDEPTQREDCTVEFETAPPEQEGPCDRESI